jgi:hypothetical protein
MDIADNRKHSDKSWFQFRFKAAFISQTAPAIQKNVPAERKIASAVRRVGREGKGWVSILRPESAQQGLPIAAGRSCGRMAWC